MSLNELGFEKSILDDFIVGLNKPRGMIIVSGPTGSGKSTTLRGALKHILSSDISIVTIEDAGTCKKKVSIEIPREKIDYTTETQYKELGKEAIIPGFRKGRAPRRLLEKRFGKETTE